MTNYTHTHFRVGSFITFLRLKAAEERERERGEGREQWNVKSAVLLARDIKACGQPTYKEFVGLVEVL